MCGVWQSAPVTGGPPEEDEGAAPQQHLTPILPPVHMESGSAVGAYPLGVTVTPEETLVIKVREGGPRLPPSLRSSETPPPIIMSCGSGLS